MKNLFSEPSFHHNEVIHWPQAELLWNPQLFSIAESDYCLSQLLNEISWKQDHIKIYGRHIPLPRLTAWYGDPDKSYIYSGIVNHPLPWIPSLLDLKSKVENISGQQFNSLLINRYRDGSDHMGWHADDEKSLGQNPVIASLNFGSTRKFQFRRKDDHSIKHEFILDHGSCLIMHGETQHYWQHQVPKTSKPLSERVNLTFRKIMD